jgi:diadenosine tetraphosphate (Ap4A) HIT family hydrolase
MNPDCIFCKIVAGDAPCHKIWEDERHLAFLTIFPNTPGFSVVITKEHQPSYIAAVPPEVADDIFAAARTVAKKLDTAFDDVGRTGFIFEGFGVDHLHCKLVPLHGTTSDEWKQHASHGDKKFFAQYEGYIASYDCARADDAELAQLAEKIRAAN